MRQIAAILAVVAALSGCSGDSSTAPDETILFSQAADTTTEETVVNTWFGGCCPCDTLVVPGCDTLDVLDGCGMGMIRRSIGCRWRGGRHDIQVLYLGKFDLRDYDYVGVQFRQTENQFFLKVWAQGSTWHTSSDLNDFIGENSVTVTLMATVDIPGGENMPGDGECAVECVTPEARLVLRDIILKVGKRP